MRYWWVREPYTYIVFIPLLAWWGVLLWLVVRGVLYLFHMLL